MASYISIVLTIFFMIFVVIHAEEAKFNFIFDKPSDYPDYDDSHYADLLKKIPSTNKVPSGEKIYHNCGSDAKERFCCSVTYYSKPYGIISNDGVHKFIVQSKFLQQPVRETKCNNENSECFKDFKAFMGNMQPMCKTNEGYIAVLVHSGKKEDKFNWMTVNINVSCSCHFVP